jgi:hypothetical protein
VCFNLALNICSPINRCRTELFKATFFNRIVYLWNNLPENIRSFSGRVAKFKYDCIGSSTNLYHIIRIDQLGRSIGIDQLGRSIGIDQLGSINWDRSIGIDWEA